MPLVDKIIKRNNKESAEKYVNEDLTNILSNAFYFSTGEKCYVLVKNSVDTKYEIDTIPVYFVKFSTLNQARSFMQNNFQPEFENIEISIVESQAIIKPTRRDYKFMISCDNEQFAQKFVKLFRRQYINNKKFENGKVKEEITDSTNKEIEKLGIRF